MPPDSSPNLPVVLCVVSDPSLARAVREALTPSSFEVVQESRAAHAVTQCLSARPDLVVLECGIDGALDLIEEARGSDAQSRVPLLVIGTADACHEALQAGAVDWIVPPVVSALLAHRAHSALRAARTERELFALRAKLSSDEAATEAAASGPSPRERFLQRADAILRDPRQRRSSAAMLVVSVEPGEGVTDAATMSACVPVLTKRVRDVLRTSDGLGAGPSSGVPVVLLEGREFSVMLEREERSQDAYKDARRLQQQLEKPIEIEGRKCLIQVNVGIAVHMHDGSNATDLHESARKAMSLARQEQLHGIRFATAAMNSSTFERLTLESNLRYALEREELTLFYQPRVDISSGAIVGFEALLRWKHPELGMVSPGQFIPIAEESGLIVPIGEWVMREACRQNQAWRDAGLPEVRMAVNLSSVQFRQPDLEVRVARVLEETGLDPNGLELELTESLLLSDADATIETLRTIKEMGIHLSIDDFGTGYSSLSYIKRFPIDALKIDQSFVRDILKSPEDAAITTSIVLMGKSLNLTVVAEGVETRSQLEFLRVLECDEAQGYLFSRPVPAKEAGECLRVGYAAMLAAAAA